MASVNENSDGPILKMLKRFHDLQSERVEAYSLFEQGFAAYLQGAPNYNFEMYKNLVNEITETFSKISQDIIIIQKELAKTSLINVAEFIGQIQDLEQQKLKLTADLQILRQKQIDSPDVLEYQEPILEANQKQILLKGQISELMDTIKYETEDVQLFDNSYTTEGL